MKFSSFIILTAAGLAIAAPITPVSTDKTLTIQPAEVVKRQTTLDPVVDAAHGKLPVPIKRATPSVSSLGALTGAVPGGLPVGRRQLGGLIPSGSSTDDSSETAEEPKIPKEPKEPSSVTDGTTEIDDGTAKPSTSSATSALGGLPIGKRQLGGLIPSGSSKDDGSSESAEEKEPKAPKEPKEPATVTDGTTEIDDGTAESSTSSATDALGGLPLGKRQLEGITGMLSPEPADPKPAEASEEAPATEEPTEEEAPAPEESEEDSTEEDAPAEGEEEPAPPADESAIAGILKRQEIDAVKSAAEGEVDDSKIIPGIVKRQLGGLTKGLIPSSTPEDAKDAEGDADAETADKDAEDETAPAEETSEEEAAPAEGKTAEETAPAKNATEPAPAKKQGLAGLLGM